MLSEVTIASKFLVTSLNKAISSLILSAWVTRAYLEPVELPRQLAVPGLQVEQPACVDCGEDPADDGHAFQRQDQPTLQVFLDPVEDLDGVQHDC